MAGPVGLLLIELAILSRNTKKGEKLCEELAKLLHTESVDEEVSVSQQPSLQVKLQLIRAKLACLVGKFIRRFTQLSFPSSLHNS